MSGGIVALYLSYCMYSLLNWGFDHFIIVLFYFIIFLQFLVQHVLDLPKHVSYFPIHFLVRHAGDPWVVLKTHLEVKVQFLKFGLKVSMDS